MAFKRVLMPMLVMGIILAMSGMAMAQTAACTVTAGGNGATNVATSTGHTEPVAAGPYGTTGTTATADGLTGAVAGGGAIHVTCDTFAGGLAFTSGVGVLTINLGVPITNTTGFPTAGTAIRVGNFSGVFTGANVGVGGLTNSTGTVVIGLGTPVATLTAAPTTGIAFPAGASVNGFDVLGVLVSLNGLNKANVTATMSITPGAGFVPGPAIDALSAVVVSAVQPGIKDPTLPSGTLPTAVTLAAGGPAVLTSNGGVIKGTFAVRIEENYASMLKAATQFNGGATFPAAGGSDTEVSLAFSNVPAGFGITGCAVTTTDVAGTGLINNGTPTLSSTFVTQAAPVLAVNFASNLDQSQINVIWLTCNVTAGVAATPLTTNISFQAFLSPTGAALSSTSTALTALTTGQIPRYQASLQPASSLTVIVFPSASTTMLIPFATVGTGFNTGIAVANTTLDTFPSGQGAVAQDGTLTFTLYNLDGTVKTYTTTTGAPGVGLTAAGVLKAGGTYAVNLSEIASKAGASANFTGYVFITANFTNAHGAATVYVNATGAATLSTPVLYVPTPSVAAARTNTEGLVF